MQATDPLSRTFAALADPTRRAILSRLKAGPATMGELAAPFRMTRPAVSQHVKVLCDAGLVERRVQAQWRSCTLRAAPLDEAERWIEEHRATWNTRFDHLDDHLARSAMEVRQASSGAVDQ